MPDKQKDLAKQLAYEQGIKEKISVAILNDKLTVDIGNNIVVNLDESQETELGMEYNLVLEKMSVGKAIREKKGNKVNIKLNMKMISEKMQSEAVKKIETQKSIDNGTVNSKDSNALRLEIEQGLKNGNAVRMEIDREISTTENMRMFIQRAWGISAQDLYRVRGKDSHSFKYVVKTSNSKEPYKEIDLSHNIEGKNSRQKIWVMQDGVLKEKTVDSLLIRGEYGIATDVADGVMSENTRTYLAIRTPRGEYIAIAAGQKSGINRNTTGNSIEKDFMSRENSVYDLEDIIKAAQIAEQIYGFNKDGKLTAKEVEFVRRLKVDKNMNDKEVINAVDTIIALKEMGYEQNDIKRILSAQNKDEIEKLAKDVDGESIGEDSQKLPGGGIRTRGGGNPHDQ